MYCRNYLYNIFCYFLLLLLPFILWYGCGFWQGNFADRLPYLVAIELAYFTGMFLGGHVLVLLLISSTVASLYFVAGFFYGLPSFDIVLPLFQTNLMEVYGYLKVFYPYILITCLFIGFCVLDIVLFKKCNYESCKQSPKWLRAILMFAFISSYSYFFTGIHIFGISYADDAFFYKCYRSIQQYSKVNVLPGELEIWPGQISTFKLNKEVNVIVIGESVRKDYMSVYGYPLVTTPFLNEVNGFFIDGMIAPCASTYHSLRNILFKYDELEANISYEKNVVSLANKAGYDTYWISNQGTTGVGDDLFFKLSTVAKNSLFLKQGRFDGPSHDDFELLKILEKVVTSNSTKKVIFLHMMGSHEPVCSQLGSFNMSFGDVGAAEVNCYLGSIEKMDNFLKQIYQLLLERKKTFNLVYFSDHGLHVKQDRIFHDFGITQAYEIPFLVLDDSATDHVVVNRKVSAMHFLDFYANLLGVRSDELRSIYSSENYTSIPIEDILIFYQGSYQSYSSLKFQSNPLLFPVIEKKNWLKTSKPNGSLDCKIYVEKFFSTEKSIRVQGWLGQKNGDSLIPIPQLIIAKCDSDHNSCSYKDTYTISREDVKRAFDGQFSNKYGFDVSWKTDNSKFLYFGRKNEAGVEFCKQIITVDVEKKE